MVGSILSVKSMAEGMGEPVNCGPECSCTCMRNSASMTFFTNRSSKWLNIGLRVFDLT